MAATQQKNSNPLGFFSPSSTHAHVDILLVPCPAHSIGFQTPPSRVCAHAPAFMTYRSEQQVIPTSSSVTTRTTSATSCCNACRWLDPPFGARVGRSGGAAPVLLLLLLLLLFLFSFILAFEIHFYRGRHVFWILHFAMGPIPRKKMFFSFLLQTVSSFRICSAAHVPPPPPLMPSVGSDHTHVRLQFHK